MTACKNRLLATTSSLCLHHLSINQCGMAGPHPTNGGILQTPHRKRPRVLNQMLRTNHTLSKTRCRVWHAVPVLGIPSACPAATKSNPHLLPSSGLQCATQAAHWQQWRRPAALPLVPFQSSTVAAYRLQSAAPVLLQGLHTSCWTTREKGSNSSSRGGTRVIFFCASASPEFKKW